jgi:hypothetical protein
MCLFTPFEGTPESQPDPEPQFVAMHLTAGEIRCPTCKRRHEVGLAEEDFWCGCTTHIVVVFAPCLYSLTA